jgi:small-conductance mechanosensitive channel
MGCLPAYAQSESPQSPPPPQVQQLLQLLQDPTVRAWIDQQKNPVVPPANETVSPAASEMMTERIAGLKDHLASLAAAIPRLPDELRAATGRLMDELQGRSAFAVLVLIGGFLVLGAGTEWLFRMATAPLQQRIVALPLHTVSERLRAIGLRLVLNLSGVVIFTLGSVGAFLAFDWPPLLRQIVADYLIAAIVLRLALVAGRFLLAPYVSTPQAIEHFRLVPMSTEAARYWYQRLAVFVGWFAFGWATVHALRILGFSPGARSVVAYVLGLGLLAISLEVAWARPLAQSGEAALQGLPGRVSRNVSASLLSVCFVLLWALWVAGFTRLFWLGAVALLLPAAIGATERAVRHTLRGPEGSTETAGMELMPVYLSRGVRALLIVGAALFLAWVWQIDLVEMTSRDTLPTRLVRGILSSIVIILIADFIWQVAKTMIDRRLAGLAAMGPPGSEEALRQARLRTLLPIFRNATFALVAVVAVLMALSALGVEIGPLIAGAGIIGVAVGFGSQTLVRDIISGIFYLLDDAFRVGEYIQSGSYKGTVESLGLRSVKLRHHRGPIYTVPYGQLGAVENMSRDWVIDKAILNVTYDTDLDKAKKIIKQIGKELAQDPEFAPHIIEPLKMQGVDQFGDFAIALRLKMMTRPGEQFAIRRQAYAMLKKAFEENGIKFAFPTVQVTGREEVEPAAAQQALKVVKGASPE